MEKIALIDLGSNTARLVIYDVLEGGYFVVSEERREAVRLGETEADGSLKQTRIMQAIATLKAFKEMCVIKRVDKDFGGGYCGCSPRQQSKDIFVGRL